MRNQDGMKRKTKIEKLSVWREFAKHFRNAETAVSYLAEIEEYETVCKREFFETGEKEVSQYYEWLEQKVRNGEISGSTLSKKFWELHSFAAYAAERKAAYDIPSGFEDFFFPWLKTAGQQEKIVQSVPVEDMDALYQAAQEDRMAYTIITCIHRVGLSTREIAELKLSDIASYENGVFAYISSREDFCYIPPDAAVIIEQYVEEREPSEGVDALFFNRNKAPLNKMYISRMLRKYTTAAGIPSYSAEKIRTTCGVTMSAYGATPVQVAKQMGITGTQIRKYKNKQYKNNLQIKANELVKIKIEAPD